MLPKRPFIRYYGGKWRAAPRYPKPRYDVIVEPFAGAAGYSMRYADLQVVLVEKYPVLAEMWRYLIAVPPAEIMRIPEVEHVDDLPSWVPEGGRTLVGFAMNAATTQPAKQLSSGRKALAARGRIYEGWTPAHRESVAYGVQCIKHWQIFEGSYADVGNVPATWYVDPPYSNRAGSYYKHADVDFEHLGQWCRERQGQVIVCENAGATWLSFEPFAVLKAGVNGKGSHEVIYTQGCAA